MADKTRQFPNMWITQNVAVRELVSVSCVCYSEAAWLHLRSGELLKRVKTPKTAMKARMRVWKTLGTKEVKIQKKK